jgi:hypothetical protein
MISVTKSIKWVLAIASIFFFVFKKVKYGCSVLTIRHANYVYFIIRKLITFMLVNFLFHLFMHTETSIIYKHFNFPNIFVSVIFKLQNFLFFNICFCDFYAFMFTSLPFMLLFLILGIEELQNISISQK